MSTTMIRVDLTEEQLRAVLDVVGKRVSEESRAAGHDVRNALFMAERQLDSALLGHEMICPECGHLHDHDWQLCENCGFDSAR